MPVGTRAKTPNGYIRVKTEAGTWRYEQELVAEDALGRPLADNERVYFKNGVKEYPTIDDLEIRTLVKKGKREQTHRKSYVVRRIINLLSKLGQAQEELKAINQRLGLPDDHMGEPAKERE
jgi:hypothetical protein